MSVAWLADVLTRHGIALDRGKLLELEADVREAFPLDGRAIAAMIRESAAVVLAQRGIRDGDGSHSLAREIGNNAAGSVVLTLQVPPTSEVA